MADQTRYELANPAGHIKGPLDFEAISALILQGQLFKQDQIRPQGAEFRALGEHANFSDLFKEIFPSKPQGPWSGALSPLMLVELFGRLHQEAQTGYLFIKGGHAERVVVFQQGLPIAARSDLADEQLGTFLLQRERLERKIVKEAIDLHIKGGAPLGQVLLEMGCLEAKELQQLLSLQVMGRLIKAFNIKSGRYHFRPSSSALEEKILLNCDYREIISTALKVSLSAAEVTRTLAQFGNCTFSTTTDPQLISDLSVIDRKILRIFREDLSLRQTLPKLEKNARIKMAEARLRVLILFKLGVIKPEEPRSSQQQQAGHQRRHTGAQRRLSNSLNAAQQAQLKELKTTLLASSRVSYFQLLGVRKSASTEEINSAFEARLEKLKLHSQEGDHKEIGEAKAALLDVLYEAREVLKDPDRRDLYERAQKLGLDLKDPEVRRRLEFEQQEQKGRSMLNQQHYKEAHTAFLRAAELQPENSKIHLMVAWSGFLGSDYGDTALLSAIREVERSLKSSPNSDDAYLILGKIYRLTEDKIEAEKNIRRAITINPHNNEAQSELRLLSSRSSHKKSKGFKFSLSGDRNKGESGSKQREAKGALLPSLSFALITTILLYLGSNFIPGGLKEWPDQNSNQAVVEAQGDSLQAELFRRAQERLQDEGVSLNVPEEDQVIGNQEYYYFSDDGWWWTRRIVLLLFGLLGILLINRENPLSFIFGSSPAWFLLAIPYGIIVGFLSPNPSFMAPTGVLLGMTLFHVLAEQLFFIGFLGRALLKTLPIPILAIFLTGLLFGIYHLSYFATINQAPADLLIQVIQISVFAGGAYAFLLWRSKGIFAPLVAHILVNMVMVLNTTMA